MALSDDASTDELLACLQNLLVRGRRFPPESMGISNGRLVNVGALCDKVEAEINRVEKLKDKELELQKRKEERAVVIPDICVECGQIIDGEEGRT